MNDNFLFSKHYSRASVLFIGMMVWISTAVSALAAPKDFSFGTTVALKEEGLKFKVFTGSKAQILPPPIVQHHTDGNGQQSELYAPRDLWYASQYRGRWVNPAGLALTLAVIGLSLPQDFAEQFVARAAYDKALAAAPAPLSNNDTLLTWLSDFSGATVKGKPRALPDSIRLANIQAIEFEGYDPYRLGYVFSLKTNNARAVSAKRHFMLFEYRNALPPDESTRMIERDFLPSVEALDGSLPEPAVASTRMQNKKVADKVERSAEFLQSREKAIDSIKGMKGWWFVETANYVLVSDLPTSQKQFVRQLQADLESLHAAYAQIIPPRVDVAAVSVARIFKKAEDYRQYVGADRAWSAGLWAPDKTELVIDASDWGSPNDRRKQSAAIVYHEAFHQYLFYAFDKLHAPAWYDEGHASFFEGAQIGKKSFAVVERYGYQKIIETLIAKKKIDLRNMFVMSYDDFYTQGGEQGRSEHYALAWGLVYYLRKGASLERSHAYDRVLNVYADTLWRTRNPEEATRELLVSLDMAKFTADFIDFWKSDAKRQAARQNAIFSDIPMSLPLE